MLRSASFGAKGGQPSEAIGLFVQILYLELSGANISMSGYNYYKSYAKGAWKKDPK